MTSVKNVSRETLPKRTGTEFVATVPDGYQATIFNLPSGPVTIAIPDLNDPNKQALILHGKTWETIKYWQ